VGQHPPGPPPAGFLHRTEVVAFVFPLDRCRALAPRRRELVGGTGDIELGDIVSELRLGYAADGKTVIVLAGKERTLPRLPVPRWGTGLRTDKFRP
jgi:hypothetical protein